MPSRKRIFDIIQIGNDEDTPSRAFDFAIMGMILVNLFIAVFETYPASDAYRPILELVEAITVIGFTVEYVLRVWTADYLYPKRSRAAATGRYILSVGGIIDLLSFLPFYLPVFFPAGMVAFRMFRVVRILRLFRINAYYDALNVITGVLKSKRDQLLSSIFLIAVLMIASSLAMYSLEHEAQPEVFANAFSGLWWSVFTILTVGYGDIYPITLAGKILAIIISFLGVGMVAIPTGIISAGFVEQYSRMKGLNDYALKANMRFVHLYVEEGHPWTGKTVEMLQLPHDLILAAIQRGSDLQVPTKETRIQVGDDLILGANDYQEDASIQLTETLIDSEHPWADEIIDDLDISRRTTILMVRRDGQILTPNPNLKLQAGDVVLTHTRKRHRM